MLVFPSGAKVDDRSGLLQGDVKNGCRIIIFTDMADLTSKEKQFQQAIKTGVTLVNK
jgi:hypothetical protein